MLKNKIEAYFKGSYKNNILFNMLKRKGKFIRLDSKLGYVYCLSLEDAGWNGIDCTVALKSGRLTIIDAFSSESYAYALA
ncbi:hypothetical protein HPT25_26355 [Bacillus sp. BRMEA1]|uniref:hypothetical protein n=1 Tax=Neobacillus endophyticus TaxID=2738405 RepID=UPI001563093E|nr:hypothetical protein [Neobacillus endophyticus]NRD80854.1 hypothetical protein [Neobacillus endophyticus]